LTIKDFCFDLVAQTLNKTLTLNCCLNLMEYKQEKDQLEDSNDANA
jgi:hypothetical protein